MADRKQGAAEIQEVVELGIMPIDANLTNLIQSSPKIDYRFMYRF